MRLPVALLLDQRYAIATSAVACTNLLPVSDRVGNCPVWSEKIVSRTSYTVVHMSRCFLPLSLLVSQTSRGTALGFIDRTFLRV